MSKHKLIYQIYPTAIGTLRDIADRIPLIAKLNVDYIWMSPIFYSPWVDGGYDVADYKRIDPRFGTMNDFRHLVAVCKKYNIGILNDLVLNHTSSEHPWFLASERHDPWYKDYYVWLDKPLNWKSFFGGPAFDYDQIRGKYYLHLYDRRQPDLNFDNPRVVKEFKEIIKFWTDRGVAGFRVDSSNVLCEDALKKGYLPRIPGFFNYYQTKKTIKVLEKLLGSDKIFTIAETVGGDYFSKARLHELTKTAFDASFNIGTLDVADTFFSIHDRPGKVRYKRWFKKLAQWTPEETFSFALESHDTPRAVSRFRADAKSLAMLQFLLPNHYPCVYQGQELGLANPKLSNNINDYPGVQSRMMYQRLREEGKSKREAMNIVKSVSRDNTRQPIDWSEYVLQDHNDNSVLNYYRQLIKLWREDVVIREGSLKVRKTSSRGVFDFDRIYDGKTYKVHIDLSSRTPSTLKNDLGQVILRTR
jgi:glycosidase